MMLLAKWLMLAWLVVGVLWDVLLFGTGTVYGVLLLVVLVPYVLVCLLVMLET